MQTARFLLADRDLIVCFLSGWHRLVPCREANGKTKCTAAPQMFAATIPSFGERL
jgi:hypothetical protein